MIQNFYNESYRFSEVFHTRSSASTQLVFLLKSIVKLFKLQHFPFQDFDRMRFDVVKVDFITEGELREIVNVLRYEQNWENSLEVVIKAVARVDEHWLIQIVLSDELIFVLGDQQRSQLAVVLNVAVDVIDREFQEIHRIVG